jgi:hypothetical protein
MDRVGQMLYSVATWHNPGYLKTYLKHEIFLGTDMQMFINVIGMPTVLVFSALTH